MPVQCCVHSIFRASQTKKDYLVPTSHAFAPLVLVSLYLLFPLTASVLDSLRFTIQFSSFYPLPAWRPGMHRPLHMWIIKRHKV